MSNDVAVGKLSSVIMKTSSKIDEPELKCGVHPRNAAFIAAVLHLVIMCMAFAGELVMTYYSLVDSKHDHPGVDPVIGTALTILAFMASASLLKGIHEENPLYILVWLLYSAYEFAMLLSVAINSTFRLVLHDHTEIFTVASEGAAAVLLILMFIIHYFVVDYYRQLVAYNEKERRGENNRLRQVSAWLRSFPAKQNQDDDNNKQCRCQQQADGDGRRRTIATASSLFSRRVHHQPTPLQTRPLHNTSDADGGNGQQQQQQPSPTSADTTLVDTSRDGSPAPTIYDCDDPPTPSPRDGRAVIVEEPEYEGVLVDGSFTHLPPIQDVTPSIGKNTRGKRRRRDEDEDSWS